MFQQRRTQLILAVEVALQVRYQSFHGFKILSGYHKEIKDQFNQQFKTCDTEEAKMIKN